MPSNREHALEVAREWLTRRSERYTNVPRADDSLADLLIAFGDEREREARLETAEYVRKLCVHGSVNAASIRAQVHFAVLQPAKGEPK
jgi:hypothetical protein